MLLHEALRISSKVRRVLWKKRNIWGFSTLDGLVSDGHITVENVNADDWEPEETTYPVSKRQLLDVYTLGHTHGCMSGVTPGRLEDCTQELHRELEKLGIPPEVVSE